MAWQGYQFVTLEWILITISFILILIRLRVAFYTLSNFAWGEIFVTIAWLLYLATGITDSVINDHDFYNTSNGALGKIFMTLPKNERISTLKFQYSQGFFYKPSIYACKAALLVYYLALTDRCKFPRTHFVIISSMVLVAIGTVVQVVYLLLVCKNIEMNWRPASYKDIRCHNKSYFYTSWTWHLFTDIIVYIIPFFIVSHAKLSIGKKLGVLAMFAVGFVNVFMAAATLAISVIQFSGPKALGASIFMQTLQQFTAILVCCMPYVRLLYRRERKRINSSIGFRSKHSSERSNDDGAAWKMPDDIVEISNRRPSGGIDLEKR